MDFYADLLIVFPDITEQSLINKNIVNSIIQNL